MKKIELQEGQRFGKLTYLCWDDSQKKDKCKCICDCGKIKYARPGRLLNGTTSSCGCGLVYPRVNLSNQRFGILTVLSEYRKCRFGGYEWLCRCDCGNEKWIRSSSLKNGDYISCGCLQKQHLHSQERILNDYDVENNIVTVYLRPNNVPMICDLDDWENLKKYTWSLSNSGYAYSKIVVAGHDMTIQFHNMILPLQDDDRVVDHINTNKLDNRRNNLRYCSRQQNNINKSTLNRNNTSGFRGVNYSKSMKKWQAQIMINRRKIIIGYYDKKEDAYQARLEAEKKYFNPLFDPSDP